MFYHLKKNMANFAGLMEPFLMKSTADVVILLSSFIQDTILEKCSYVSTCNYCNILGLHV